MVSRATYVGSFTEATELIIRASTGLNSSTISPASFLLTQLTAYGALKKSTSWEVLMVIRATMGKSHPRYLPVLHAAFRAFD